MESSNSSLSVASAEVRPMFRPRKESDVSEDSNIQATNDDASESKYSAVGLGYWNDPYLQYFVRKAERKSPEIHRGYYARVKAIRTAVDNFLSAFDDRSTQIINLGCGFDTLFWHLRNAGDNCRLPNIFVDVDFSTVTAKKIHHILKPSSPLRKSVADENDHIQEVGHKNLYGPIYRLVGADIRNTSELNSQLIDAGVDFARPTLFVSECVLVYMSVEQGNELVKDLAAHFPNAYFVNYDPVNLKDKFGTIFKENMYTRGLFLAGADACLSMDSQWQRFCSNGWRTVQTWTLREIYSILFAKEEVARIERIEPLDEKELLDQLLEHYCVVLARNNSASPPIRFP